MWCYSKRVTDTCRLGAKLWWCSSSEGKSHLAGQLDRWDCKCEFSLIRSEWFLVCFFFLNQHSQAGSFQEVGSALDPAFHWICGITHGPEKEAAQVDFFLKIRSSDIIFWGSWIAEISSCNCCKSSWKSSDLICFQPVGVWPDRISIARA